VKTLIQQIVSILEQYPQSTAIEGDNFSITNEQLLQKSRDYAHGILQLRIEDSWIGINTNLGWEAYAAILSCWMTGNGYVPLNTKFPPLRIREVIQQTDLKYCFGSSDLIEVLPFDGFSIDLQIGEKAYLMFTSGTTGIPKGVPVLHKNLKSFTEHYLNHKDIKFTTSDKFLQSYELTFDVSVFCFLMPFLTGGTLVMPPKTKSKQLSFFKAITDFNVTVVSFVPSVVRLTQDFLPRVKFPRLRYSFFCGEVLKGDWAKVWMESVPNAKVYNCYGPTETVIVCTEELLNDLDDAYFSNGLPLPLGEKFEEIDLEIIDREIVFSGNQTFAGYLNQEPISQYYTGDLAHYDKNRKLIFEGRKDNQIQWNGYRIELEEMDRILTEKSNGWIKTIFIKDCSKLIVFSDQLKGKIISLIHDSFPDYYKPSSVIQLDKLPLNMNDKVDLAKLEEIALSN
tara:strand:- start:372 stop:1730 length:1359 start_codon:yes stop_codon:yes gene_type:complete